ncbi:uncharacterized protein DS421_2g37980 [Arachis hypogaea]|nr:uncharacterized protein DS421_2g37980 [Arachis hypogaea]
MFPMSISIANIIYLSKEKDLVAQRHPATHRHSTVSSTPRLWSLRARGCCNWPKVDWSNKSPLASEPGTIHGDFAIASEGWFA